MASSLKFKREKVSSLLGHTEVRYIEEGTAGDENKRPFMIIADPMGVRFEGGSSHITGQEDLEMFASTVGAAFHDHVALKPKIVMTPSGH